MVQEHSVMYPIDLLKVRANTTYNGRWMMPMLTRLETQTRMQVVNPTPAAVYTGIGNAIATISRAEGYMSLWRGISSVVLGAGMRRTRRLYHRQENAWI